MKAELTLANSLLKLGIRHSISTRAPQFVTSHSHIRINRLEGSSPSHVVGNRGLFSLLPTCNSCSNHNICHYYSTNTTSSIQPQAEAVSNSTSLSLSSDEEESSPSKMSLELIRHLERTSLVDFGNEEAIVRLQEAIKFADVLFEVDTTGVKPLDSVLENETLYLREDEAKPTSRKDILLNASVVVEDYFVAPPGNIPLDSTLLQASDKISK